MSDPRLPSSHEKDRLRKEQTEQEQALARRRRDARERQAFDWLLKQENGRIFWAWFFRRCGYNKTILMRLSGGDVAPLSTEALAAIREVYLDARKMIESPEVLSKAEFEAEFEEVKPEESKGESKDGRRK